MDGFLVDFVRLSVIIQRDVDKFRCKMEVHVVHADLVNTDGFSITVSGHYRPRSLLFVCWNECAYFASVYGHIQQYIRKTWGRTYQVSEIVIKNS